MNFLKSNVLIYGDNIKALEFLYENHIKGIRLAYLDPPYCSNTNNEHYSDCFCYEEYMANLKKLLQYVLYVLDDNGIIALQTDSVHSFDIKNLMDQIVGHESYKGQIVIGKYDNKRYKGTIDRLISGYDCLLLYAKNSKTRLPALIERRVVEHAGVWTSFYTTTPNPKNRYSIFGIKINVGAWRKSRDWAQTAIENYRDLEQFIRSRNLPNDDMEKCIHDFVECKKIKKQYLSFLRYKDHSVQYYLPPSHVIHFSDNWSDLNIRGSNTDFEHEVSMPFLQRLFRWLTRKGDIILDPYLGSGVSIIVASRFKRKWIGIEKEPYCKTVILDRIRHLESKVRFYEI